MHRHHHRTANELVSVTWLFLFAVLAVGAVVTWPLYAAIIVTLLVVLLVVARAHRKTARHH